VAALAVEGSSLAGGRGQQGKGKRGGKREIESAPHAK